MKKERELQEERLRGMDIDTPTPTISHSAPVVNKEFKPSNTNKEQIEAQLNELRKEFYQKDETIDDILRKRTTIVERKIF